MAQVALPDDASEHQGAPESILIADCGAVATKVGLIDCAGGEYRLVGVTRAMTTVEPPDADITLGVLRAAAQLESMTGRQLLTEQGELLQPEQASGDGVDAFVACTSAALPLRTAIIGLSRDFSVASARRALASTYAVVEHTIAVDEESGRWGTTARDGRAGGPSAAVENLAAARPEVIVMVGGTDGGASTPLVEMANIVAAIGAAIEESARPLVIFAGNREQRATVAERLSDLEFRTVDNVRPTLDFENLAPLAGEMEAVYYQRRIRQLPGMERLAAWSTGPILTALTGYEKVVQFLARHYDLRVLGVDLGGATTTLIYADRQRTTRAVAADLGLGYGLDELLKHSGLERVARWLPNSIALDEAHAFLLNQALRPWTTPVLPADRQTLNAAAREAITLDISRAFDGELPEADLVLLGGAPLARGTGPNALVSLALDALPLRGVFSIAADTTGLAPALGAMAAVNPDAAAQVMEQDALLTLGTVWVPTLPALPGEAAGLQALVETPSGGRLDVQVAAGSLELVPLGLGQKARVRIPALPGVSSRLAIKRYVFDRELEGGAVGVIIDARGRPLPLGGALEQQRERAQRWLWEIGA